VAVLGIGIDVVDLRRFAASLGRTPGLAARVLVDAERSDRPERMAARFAAKEALAKALGAPAGLRWHDAWVVTGPGGRPDLRVAGTVARACADRGVTHLHVSLSHDGPVAVAVVVLEG
jgi:holo-[acyl-carrier protein] synthase